MLVGVRVRCYGGGNLQTELLRMTLDLREGMETEHVLDLANMFYLCQNRHICIMINYCSVKVVFTRYRFFKDGSSLLWVLTH